MNDNVLNFINTLLSENKMVGQKIEIEGESYFPLYKLKMASFKGEDDTFQYVSLNPCGILSGKNKEVLMDHKNPIGFDFDSLINDKTLGIFDKIISKKNKEVN